MINLRRYRHFNRYKQVANTLIKHGFGHLIDTLGLDEILPVSKTMREEKVNLSTPERIVKVLQDLGPTFVKIGQVLSTRIDMLPHDYIKELENLQDNVPPLSETEVRNVIETEFGKRTEEVFPEFHWQPLASASIGQVHLAKFPAGTDVVVKVQRPGIKELMEIDLEILFDLARFLDKRTSWVKQYGLLGVVEELSNSLKGEIEYSLEGRNSEKIRNNFKDCEEVLVPRVYWEYTTNRVLVLEYIESVKISNLEELNRRKWDINQIASKFVSAMITQIFVHGFFHADPHPGNVGVCDGKIVFMDYGQIGKIDEWAMNKYIDLIIHLIRQDVTGVVNVLLEFGVVDEQVERKKLERDITRLKQKYYRTTFGEINVGLALREMLKVIQEHNVKVSAEFVLMIKALLTVEGVVQQLNPQLSIVEIAEPFGVELFKKKYNIQNITKHLVQQTYENLKMIAELPKQINSLLLILEEGRLKMRIEHGNLKNIILGLNVASNRISISIVLASIIVGSSLITQKFEGSILSKVPVAEIGFLLAVVLGIGLVFSILRRGNY